MKKLFERLLLAVFTMLFAVATSQAAPTLFIHDSNARLARVDVETGQVDIVAFQTIVGVASRVLTDIAFNSRGEVYALDFTYLYKLNLNSGQLQHIGRHQIPRGNALVFGPNDTLYAAGSSSTSLFKVDLDSGLGVAIGNIQTNSAGDLAFIDGDGDGTEELYLSSKLDQLVRINLPDELGGQLEATVVGAIGFRDVYGLAVASDGQLYGVSGQNVIVINTTTGQGSFVLSYAGQDLGNANGSSFFLGVAGREPNFFEVDSSCPPAQGERSENLIVIVHGWNSNPAAWGEGMVQEMRNRQFVAGIVDRWDVCAHDWSEGANTGVIDIIPIQEPAVEAWRNAGRYGRSLGHRLFCGGYSNIHFIAHSAGSQLIQSAMQYIEDAYVISDEVCDDSKPLFHATFLDAFDPYLNNSAYGSVAEYVEHFVDKRGPPQTDRDLTFAANYDVSELDPVQDTGILQIDSINHHAWPHEWYKCTTMDPLFPPADPESCGGHAALGFRTSLGYGVEQELSAQSEFGSCTLSTDGVISCEADEPSRDERESIYVTTPAILIEATQGDTGTVLFNPPGSVSDPLVPYAELRSGSPAWLSILFESKGPFNSVKLDYRFLSDTIGVLSIYLDGERVFTADEAFSLEGINKSQPVWAGENEAGLHTLTLRLDSSSDERSIVEVLNAGIGNAAIEPLFSDGFE
ncbi:hypothetical protein ACFL3I_14065 [Pseudomonadota bacterium]